MSDSRSISHAFTCLDSLPIGAVVLRDDRTVVFWNVRMEKWTGVSRAEIVGTPIGDRFPTLTTPAYDNEIRTAIAEGRPAVFSPRHHGHLFGGSTADGTERLRRTTITAFLDPGNNERYTVIAVEDMTDLAEEIRRLKEPNGAEVLAAAETEREAALLEKQAAELARERDNANARSRQKSEFLAAMSHEIRTPMNGIVGMASLLLTTELSEEQREYAEVIESSADALLTIINEILDLSKIEAGRMELESNEFDVGAIVEEAVGLLAERAHQKPIDLACLVDADVPAALVGDAGRVRQVILNIVGNAVKFTRQGEVVVRVERVEDLDRDTVVRVTVRDTGPGIPVEMRSALFKPFRQGDTSTARTYGGTGLGLTISKRLVEAMRGEIGFESTPGESATFWFTVRLRRLEPAVSVNDDDRSSALAGCRALAVGVPKATAGVLAAYLPRFGVDLERASDESEALRSLRRPAGGEVAYRLLIIDASAGENGADAVIQSLRAEVATRDVPVLLLATGPESGEEVRCAAGRGTLLIKKPVRYATLREAVRSLLSAETTARPEPHQSRSATGRAGVASRGRTLVVEDNPVNQRLAVAQLARIGFEADCADNGRIAVEMCSRHRYAAILMDCQMPEMDGFEATAVIRRHEGRERHTPIIAVTANAMQGDRERCLEAGMDDYISKPVRIDVLTATMDKWCPVLQPDAAPERKGAAVPQADTVLDHAWLERQVEGDAELLADVVDTFLADSMAVLDEIRQSIAAGDAAMLQCAAHRLKGSLGSLGARPAEEAARRLEAFGRGKNLSEAQSALSALDSEIARLEPELGALKSGATR